MSEHSFPTHFDSPEQAMESFTRRRALKTLFCSSALLGLNIKQQAMAELKPDDRLDRHLMMVGDFGTADKIQAGVARAMGKYLAKSRIKPEGLWLMGDNFYNKLDKGVKSSRWRSGFEQMYSQGDFPGPCWAMLGNHDYHDTIDGEKAQLAYKEANPRSRWHMPAKWYRVDWPAVNPLATFLVVDTNWRSINESLHKGSIGKRPPWWMSEAEEVEQEAWLKAELAKPRVAPFLFVMGHHPFYTNGAHGDTKPLIAKWGGLLQANAVDFYCCGHDHDLQHLELEGLKTSFVVSGAGGQRVTDLKNRHQGFAKAVYGFTHLQASKERIIFRHLDANGVQLHAFSRDAAGTVAEVA